jgi:hypothetical protein
MRPPPSGIHAMSFSAWSSGLAMKGVGCVLQVTPFADRSNSPALPTATNSLPVHTTRRSA